MASNPIVDRKYELHRKLYNNLKDNLTQEEFLDLRNLCKIRFFRPGRLERIKSVTELLDALEAKGVIGIDKGYEELKKLLTESGLENNGFLDDILSAEAELSELNQESEQVFPVPVAHVSRYKDNFVKRRRISDPGDIPLHVKRKRLSRTESDADADNVYPTSPDSHNLLLIIDQFTGEREGGEVDYEALDDLFRNTLHFSDIILKRNLNKDDFTHALSEVANFIKNSPHTFDRLFVAIFGHGCQSGIKTCATPSAEEHNKFMTMDEIIAPFKSVVLPQMAGKPKVFLIQACQGKESMNGLQKDGHAHPSHGGVRPTRPNTLKVDLGGTRPDDADFLICNSTTQKHVSYRDTSEGSWFIRHLVQVFRDKFQKEHVMDMMTEINRRVASEEAHTPDAQPSQTEGFPGPKKQVPCQVSTLTSKIVLTHPHQ